VKNRVPWHRALVAISMLCYGVTFLWAETSGIPSDNARLQLWVHYDYMVAPDGTSDAPGPPWARLTGIWTATPMKSGNGSPQRHRGHREEISVTSVSLW
jgi:hypothetical protein